MISVIIPTYNEENHIYKLLKTISSYPSINEILIIDGMSSDDTRLKINKFISLNKRNDIAIRILENKKKLQGYALNIGIKSSKNDLIVRIDAHSIIEKFTRKDYFEEIANRLKTNKYSMVGFKQRFMFESFFQASIYTLSFTYFLSKAKYRYTNKEVACFDTAWLFAINKKDAIAVNFLNPEATPNEDYDFCQRLITEKSKPILIFPQLPIYYLPRTNLISLAKQYFRYGYSRAKTIERLDKKYLLSNNFLKLIIDVLIVLIFISVQIIIFTNIKPYLILMGFILLSFCVQNYFDKLSFLRISKFNKIKKTNLLLGFLLAPIISTVPFLSRTIGFIAYNIKTFLL